MKKFKEYYDEFIVELNERHKQNKKLDSNLYYQELTKFDTKVYNNNSRTDNISTIQDMKNVIAEQEACTKFNDGYIVTETKVETEVEGYGLEGGDIEVEYVLIQLVTRGIRPYTDEEFNKILSQELILNRLFKDYLKRCAIEIYTKANPDKPLSSWEKSTLNLECKLIELFKDDILDFNQLVKATFKNCSI